MARAMEVIGDRWTILVLREAYYGVTRFDEFEYYVGVAPNILSNRLKKLVDAGIMKRMPLQEHSGRYDYGRTCDNLSKIAKCERQAAAPGRRRGDRGFRRRPVQSETIRCRWRSGRGGASLTPRAQVGRVLFPS